MNVALLFFNSMFRSLVASEKLPKRVLFSQTRRKKPVREPRQRWWRILEKKLAETNLSVLENPKTSQRICKLIFSILKANQ